MLRSAAAMLLSLLCICALVACGGSSSSSNAPNRNITQLHDPKSAPTASPPASLPTPIAASNLPALSAAAATPPPDVYIVKAGDTLSSIAEQLGVSVSALQQANGITDPRSLQIGQQLKVPQPGQTPAPSATARSGGPSLGTPGPQPTAAGGPVNIPIPTLNGGGTVTASPSAGSSEYVVKAGDSACKIATENKITVQELAAANNMTVSQITRLQPGQVLKIPPSTGHIGCS
jgi:LysM repeat protein